MSVWDRWVIIAFGVGIGIRSGWKGWQWGKGGDWLAGAGGILLAIIAAGVPFILALLGPATGR
jgi:hypothetical protein